MIMPDSFMKQNMEMWEKFTTTYMDTLFKTVEKAMEQSQTIKDRMDKAAAQAVSSQLDAALTSLEALQRQVEALSEKVDKLVEEE